MIFDIGYLKHCIGVYLLGLIAVILFIVFNCGNCKNLKELLIGGVAFIFIYTLIFALIFLAVPLLSI